MDQSTQSGDSLENTNSLENTEGIIQPTNSTPTTTEKDASSGGDSSPAPRRVQKFDFQSYVRSMVNKVNVYFLLFVFILILACVVLFVAIQSSKNQAKKDETATQKLTEDALKSLEGSDAKVGDPKQLLSIESNAIFAGKVMIKDGLEVAGAIKVGGALSLPGITVSGTSQFDQVQLNSLSISGNATIQGQLTVQKGLSVAANGSFAGTLSAPVISTDKLVLNQDLQLNRHIDAGGATPSISPGGAIGGGGTVSISGSDTAGTVTVNNGGGSSAGIVATVTFSVRFSANPHVVITPVCSSACNLGAYVISRTANGFSIGVINNPGGSYSFDFIALD